MSSMSSDEQNAAFLTAMQQQHQQQSQNLQLPQQHQQQQQQQSHPPPPTAAQDQPPRKAQRRPSTATAKDSHSQSSGSASTSTDAPPSGPPYICPICQTTYSRLEYLRRHERRHQDIRPFVCECGKSFSRSDVLSRHKRQCHFHLTGEKPTAEAADAAAKKVRKPSTAKGKGRKSNGPDDASPGASASSSMITPRKGSSTIKTGGSPQPPPPMGHPAYATSTQPGVAPPLLPRSGAPGSIGLPPPPPFYSQGEPSAGHTSNPQDTSSNDFARQSGFMSAISHALNNFSQSNAANYPPSPESSASLNNSRNSSPRLPYRDAIPYTQRSGGAGGSRQSSLRKGTLDLYHNQAPWETHDGANRGSPAPGSAPGSRPGSVYGGGSSRTSTANTTAAAVSAAINAAAASSAGGSGTSAPAFSYPANEFAGGSSQPPSSSSGASNQTLVAAAAAAAAMNDQNRNNSSGSTSSAPGSATNSADTSRFAALSTGPLSPFSGMGLNSMSPYLSAFSNARDTPLVASPGRSGIAPGTPTSQLTGNVFDYTMRPPAKPASSTTPGKTGSGSTGGSGTSSSDKPSSISIPASAATTAAGKRKEAGSSKDDPELPSASVGMSTTESGALPALADFIDDQQRTAANGLLTLLGGGGQETPSRFVRSEAGGNNDASSRNRTANGTQNAMDNNPGTTSANPSSNPFFESAVTPGPEAFLLRLQGGEQDRRAGMLAAAAANAPSAGISAVGTQTTNGNGNNQDSHPSSSTSVSSALTAPSANLFDTPGLAPWDFGGVTSSHGHPSSVGWLLSPSVQTLISSFAGSTPHGPGEGGSYFPMSRRTSGLIETYKAGDKDKEGGAADITLSAASTTAPTLAAAPSSNSNGGTTDIAQIGHMALERALEDANNPFYLPKTMFRPCYNIPHWDLPPLTRLSVLAMHAQQNLLKHVPILHEPTFRLDTTPGCLAFAACMLGCHETGRRWWAGEEVVPMPEKNGKASSPLEDKKQGDEEEQSKAITAASKPLIDEEDGQELVKPIVMTEKVDMLMRSFTGRAQSEKDKVSVVQALMLFQTNSFISSDATTRNIAAVSHGSVVSVARKAGFFDVAAPHVSRAVTYTAEQVMRSVAQEKNDLCFGFSYLPSYLPGCPDEDKVWRQWCEYEGRRRTAFLLTLMDTVASLDAGLPTLVELDEVKHLPLPAPDSIWRASDAKAWKEALDKYEGPTFDEAMRGLFSEAASTGDKTNGNGSAVGEGKGTASSSVIEGAHGPFARLMMILPILRGIVHLLQARADGAQNKESKPSPVEPWLPKKTNQGDAAAATVTANESADIATFERALGRWRSAWDADSLCLHASSPVAQAKAEAEQRAREQAAKLAAEEAANASNTEGDKAAPAGGSATSPPPAPVFTSKTASGATPLCEDALPFYWLSHVLLGHANGRKAPSTTLPKQEEKEDGVPDEKDGKEGAAAQALPDFRSMLRFAKTFVNAGEGAAGSASSISNNNGGGGGGGGGGARLPSPLATSASAATSMGAGGKPKEEETA